MLYREMPKTKEMISTLGFGVMRLPGGKTPKEPESIELLRRAIDLGINYFDTGWPYHGGKSEVVLGKALKDGYREKVKVADKLPQWMCQSREDMDYYFKEQLKRLDMDHIDYYLIHTLNGESWERVKALGIFDFMDKLKASGKISHIGFSFHGQKEEFKTILDDYDWDFCQIQFNILDDQYQAGLEGLDYAASKDIGVIIMEPLRGGALAGKLPVKVEKLYKAENADRSAVDWALRWIWNHPGVVTILSGMSTMEQLEENVTIATTATVNSMSVQEVKTVQNAADTFRDLMKVPCTSCQYCMPCPFGVDIPMAFLFYNNKYLFNKGFGNRAFYLLQAQGAADNKPAFASVCTGCGKCIEHCPQNIDIPKELLRVKKEFEGFWKKPILFLANSYMTKGRRKK